MKKLLLLIAAFAFIAIVNAQESKNDLDAKVADLVSELTYGVMEINYLPHLFPQLQPFLQHGIWIWFMKLERP